MYLIKYIQISVCLMMTIPCFNSIKLHHNNVNGLIIPFQKKISEYSIHTQELSNKIKSLSLDKVHLTDYHHPNQFFNQISKNIIHVGDYVSDFKPGVILVRGISSLLPHVDSIGHNILHANNEFISGIFDNDLIPYEHKKEIILLSIRLAQMGDDMGSHLLQLYYDIVDKSL